MLWLTFKHVSMMTFNKRRKHTIRATCQRAFKNPHYNVLFSTKLKQNTINILLTKLNKRRKHTIRATCQRAFTETRYPPLASLQSYRFIITVFRHKPFETKSEMWNPEAECCDKFFARFEIPPDDVRPRWSTAGMLKCKKLHFRALQRPHIPTASPKQPHRRVWL